MKERASIREAKESQIRLQDALGASGVAVFQQDLDLRYTWVFHIHAGMLHGTDIIGKTDADWLPPKEAEAMTKLKTPALKGRVGIRSAVKTTPFSNGKVYYNDIRVEPIFKRRG